MRALGRAAAAGVAVLLAGVAVLLAACGTPAADLPHAGDVLQRGAQAMAGVSSTAFSLIVGGDTSALPITSADGRIQRDGQADGDLVIGGQNYPFRLVAGTFYLQNPDNSWVSSPPAYDPTTLLDPTTGIASLLSGATGATTVGQASMEGQTTDEVKARVPDTLIKQLSDLTKGQDTLAATLWIGDTDGLIYKFVIPFRAPDTDGPTTVTVTLKDYNKPVHVVPPKS